MVLEDGYFIHTDDSMQEGFLVEDCETGFVGFIDKYERADDKNEFLQVTDAGAMMTKRYRRRRLFRRPRSQKGREISKGRGEGKGKGWRTRRRFMPRRYMKKVQKKRKKEGKSRKGK